MDDRAGAHRNRLVSPRARRRRRDWQNRWSQFTKIDNRYGLQYCNVLGKWGLGTMVRPVTRDGALGLSLAVIITAAFWLAVGLAVALAYDLI